MRLQWQKSSQLKGVLNDNPLIVHVSSPREVEAIAQINPLAQKLMAAFWPGPLTLVLPKKPCVPNAVTAGGSTVAVRLQLIRQHGP